jgi:hypothetical protein
MRRLSVLFLACVITAACSEPPNKEMNRAQGAIDAARSAGAAEYAREPFGAATTAMQQSHEAVDQRDYRLALSRAIDAYERAQEAAKLAADGKAKARADAEMAVSSANAAALQLENRLDAADAARVPPRELLEPRRTAKDAVATLQKARASLAGARYDDASAAVKGLAEQIRGEIGVVEETIAARGGHRVPRKR